MPRELLASSDIRVRISSDHASGSSLRVTPLTVTHEVQQLSEPATKTRIMTSTTVYQQDEVVSMSLHTEQNEKSTSRNNLLNKNILQKLWVMIIIILITSCSSFFQSSWLHTTVPCQTLYEPQSKDFYNPNHLTSLPYIFPDLLHTMNLHMTNRKTSQFGILKDAQSKSSMPLCWRKNVLTDGR